MKISKMQAVDLLEGIGATVLALDHNSIIYLEVAEAGSEFSLSLFKNSYVV